MGDSKSIYLSQSVLYTYTKRLRNFIGMFLRILYSQFKRILIKVLKIPLFLTKLFFQFRLEQSSNIFTFSDAVRGEGLQWDIMTMMRMQKKSAIFWTKFLLLHP